MYRIRSMDGTGTAPGMHNRKSRSSCVFKCRALEVPVSVEVLTSAQRAGGIRYSGIPYASCIHLARAGHAATARPALGSDWIALGSVETPVL
jgi:hypothetical protein